MAIIVLDIGGTKIRTVSFNKKLQMLYSLEIPTEANKGKEQVLKNILKSIDFVMQETRKSTKESINRLGLSMPGIIKDGKIIFPGKSLSFFKDFRIKNYLENKSGLETIVFNDADSFLVAETLFGNHPYKKLLGIIVGSGLGSSMIVRKNINSKELILIKGSELGHIKIYDEENKKYVILESLVGGKFIEKEYYKLTKKHKNLKEIYLSKEKIAKKLINKMIKYLALGLSYVINIYGPEVVVLGGGVINLPIIKQLNSFVSKLVIPIYSKVKIKRYSIEDDEGIFGIASLTSNAGE